MAGGNPHRSQLGQSARCRCGRHQCLLRDGPVRLLHAGADPLHRTNTSATIEFREHEIEELTDALHGTIERGEGYISAALLARFDANATFPRLPFEPIDAETYERMQSDVMQRRVSSTSSKRFSATTWVKSARLDQLAAIPTSACCHWRSLRTDHDGVAPRGGSL